MLEPDETRFVRLGDVASFIRGVTFKPTDLEDPSESNVDCMRTKNVQVDLDRRDVWSVPMGIVKRRDQLLREGDLLVSSANSWNLVGKACCIPELERPTTFGGFVSVLRPEKADARYLFRWFTSDKVQTTMRSFGNQTTNISNLDLKRASNLSVPLPPLDEQRRIAAILDKADELRAKRRRALAHLDTLTQSIFHSMFAGESRDAVLSDAIGKLVGGKNVVGPDDSPNAFRVLKISSVTSGRYLEMESKPLPEGYIPPREHVVREGDVVISRANTTELVGASALARSTNGTSVLPDKLWRAVPTSRTDPRFLLATLQSTAVREEISRRSTGSGGSMKNISQPKLLSVPIVLPSLELQQTFATRIAAVERLNESHRKHLAELDALFASLQHRAFKGDL